MLSKLLKCLFARKKKPTLDSDGLEYPPPEWLFDPKAPKNFANALPGSNQIAEKTASLCSLECSVSNVFLTAEWDKSLVAEKQPQEGSEQKPLEQSPRIGDPAIGEPKAGKSSEDLATEPSAASSPRTEASSDLEQTETAEDIATPKPAETAIKKPKLTKAERDARWERRIRIRDRREARILRENCISQSGLN